MNMRIGGLASGMDIDTMVKQLMTAERMPLDKLFQKKQTLEWQRDAYREVNLSLSKFRDAYSKLRLQSTFIAYGVSASNASVVSGKATSKATPGSYELTVDNLAKVASVRSVDKIASLNSGSSFSGTGPVQSTASRTIAIDAENIGHGDILTINGETVEFYDSSTGGASGAAQHAIDIYDADAEARKSNSKIAQAIAGLELSTTEVKLSSIANRVTITATDPGNAGNLIVIEAQDADGNDTTGITNTGNLTGGSDTRTLKITGIPESGSSLFIGSTEITFYSSDKDSTPTGNAIDTYGKTKEQIAQDIRDLSDSIPDATLGGEGSEITVTSTAGITTSFSSSAKSGDRILAPGETSKSFTVTTAVGTKTIVVTSSDTYGSLAKKINDASITKDGKTVSLGLRANFDDTTSRFFISTKEMGSDQFIEFGGTDINFVTSQIFGDETLVASDLTVTGENAKFTFDGITVDNYKSNQVSINGIDLTLMGKTATPVTITVSSDTDALFDTIKEFVGKYNELIEDLNTRINETKYRDYPPLTDEQRKELSDKEAEMWDEKAQSGMLRNDALLRGTLDRLRRALYDPVEGISNNQLNQISEIGITTGDYRNGGKLELNEEKLREALDNNPDEVMNLFTKVEEQTGKTSQMGIGSRIYEELNNSLNFLRDKAGTPGYTSGDQSTIGKTLYDLDDEIDSWQDRLVQVERRYWRQFNAMEQAINQLNQQSMWMQQNMFGNG